VKPVQVSTLNGGDEIVKTIVDLYTQLDFKTRSGMEPEELRRPLTVRAVSQVQRYFQHLRPLEDMDAEDGDAMGIMLIDSIDAFKKNNSSGTMSALGKLALTVMMEKNAALRGLHRDFAWFSPVLIKVLENKPAPASTVGKRLEELTAADGGKIGKSMSAMLIANATAAAAVDEWIRAYPSMKEFAEKMPFFRPFMEKVAAQQLQAASFGLKFRVGLGAAFSSLDMGSDVVVVSELFAAGETGKAWAVVAMVAVNLVVQLWIVFTQKRKRPKIMAREMLLTVACLKPALDALGVVSGKEQEHFEPFPPQGELMLTKVAEVSHTRPQSPLPPHPPPNHHAGILRGAAGSLHPGRLRNHSHQQRRTGVDGRLRVAGDVRYGHRLHDADNFVRPMFRATTQPSACATHRQQGGSRGTSNDSPLARLLPPQQSTSFVLASLAQAQSGVRSPSFTLAQLRFRRRPCPQTARSEDLWLHP
jgi:hypothetical protein